MLLWRGWAPATITGCAVWRQPQQVIAVEPEASAVLSGKPPGPSIKGIELVLFLRCWNSIGLIRSSL